MSDLRGIANAVIRRAERQGYVVPREIRAELSEAGLPETQWKEVVALARQSLSCRNGRYYYLRAVSPRRQEQEQQRQTVREVVGRVIAQQQAQAARDERRQEGRVSFVQPVEVHTEDGRTLRLLSRDLSPTGIRLIGTRGLLGQKIRVMLPQAEGEEPAGLVVRILWTGMIADGLFESGGTFLELAPKDI
jgi:hypothetical protein